MTDTRKEFEEFYKNEPLAGRECYDWCLQTWQSCQQLNNKRIQQLLALVEKKNEALMLQASHMEMYSLQISHANDYAKITRAIDLEPEDVELVEVNHVDYVDVDPAHYDVVSTLDDGEKLYKIQMKGK